MNFDKRLLSLHHHHDQDIEQGCLQQMWSSSCRSWAQGLSHPSCYFFGSRLQLPCKFASKGLPCNPLQYCPLPSRTTFFTKRLRVYPILPCRCKRTKLQFSCFQWDHTLRGSLHPRASLGNAEAGTLKSHSDLAPFPSCPIFSIDFLVFHGGVSTISTCIWIFVSGSVTGESELRPTVDNCNREKDS